jgi:hypothetical protein
MDEEKAETYALPLPAYLNFLEGTTSIDHAERKALNNSLLSAFFLF